MDGRFLHGCKTWPRSSNSTMAMIAVTRSSMDLKGVVYAGICLIFFLIFIMKVHMEVLTCTTDLTVYLHLVIIETITTNRQHPITHSTTSSLPHQSTISATIMQPAALASLGMQLSTITTNILTTPFQQQLNTSQQTTVSRITQTFRAITIVSCLLNQSLSILPPTTFFTTSILLRLICMEVCPIMVFMGLNNPTMHLLPPIKLIIGLGSDKVAQGMVGWFYFLCGPKLLRLFKGFWLCF